MNPQELVKKLGELLGWEFLEATGPLPPVQVLEQSLNAERRPIFWISNNLPSGTFKCLVAEPGPKAVPWNPLEDADHRARIIAKAESLGVKVSVHDGLTVYRPDGHSITYTSNSPQTICEAVLEALATGPPD